MSTTDPKQNFKQSFNTLIVLDGIIGISRANAMQFLNMKRDLLDANSPASDYLDLSIEYDRIGAMTEAAEMWQKYEAMNHA